MCRPGNKGALKSSFHGRQGWQESWDYWGSVNGKKRATGARFLTLQKPKRFSIAKVQRAEREMPWLTDTVELNRTSEAFLVARLFPGVGPIPAKLVFHLDFLLHLIIPLELINWT